MHAGLPVEAYRLVLGRPLLDMIRHALDVPLKIPSLFVIVFGHAPVRIWFGGQSLYYFTELASSRGMSLGVQSLGCSTCQDHICFLRGRKEIQFFYFQRGDILVAL